MEHAKERLSEYLDGALAESERRAVEEHLSACAGCKAELEELRSVSKLVAGLPQEPLPAGFMGRLNRRLAAGEPKRWAFSFSGPYAWQAATAFAAAGVVAMVVVYHESRLKMETADMGAVGQLESARMADLSAAGKDQKSYWRSDVRAKGEPLAAAAPEAGAAGAALGLQPSIVAPAIPAPTRTEGSNEAIHSFLQQERARMGIRDIVGQPQAVRAAGQGAESQSGGRPMDKQEAMNYVRQMTAQLASINRARQSRLPPAVAVSGLGKPKMLEASEASHPLGAAAGPSEAAASASASADSLALLRGQAVPLPEAAEPPLNIAPRAVSAKKAASPPPRFDEPTTDFRWKKSWSGAASGLIAGYSVIKDRSHWEALWTRLGLTANAPDVDFQKQMVLVVMGKEGSGVEIGSVHPQGPTLWVSYQAIPAKEESAGKTPYHIVVVPRSGLDVAFEESK